MKYFKKEQLIEEIKSLTRLIELKSNDDSTVIISEHGGRPLGFFPSIKEYSLLWINPNIRQLIEAGDIPLGGDRYWISPERSFFYENPFNFEGWSCPKGIDPANFKVLNSSNDSCIVESDLSFIDNTSRKNYKGLLTRQFSIIQEPIQTGLQNIAIEIIDKCIIHAELGKMNGWSLAQIITGGPDNPGTVLIPTRKNPKPLAYFNEIPSDRLHVGENYISFKIDASEVHKVAIKPEDINFQRSAKIAYLLKIPDSENYGLLIKLSEDVPQNQSQTLDEAKNQSITQRGSIQSYNDKSPDEPPFSFGEIELHFIPFSTDGKVLKSIAKHQLIGYIGTIDEMLQIIEKYLGIVNPIIF
ncbi:MAG: hypothetical protein JW891_12425 [Candidatus Lokiarchaeota archaeon]|nr:hypothetical protein [Candidatus Lokiarchaeota archaeon]